MFLPALLLAALVDGAPSASRRARAQELAGRLGVVPAPPARPGTLGARLADLRARQGPGAEAFARSLVLLLEGHVVDLGAYTPVGPLYGWVTREWTRARTTRGPGQNAMVVMPPREIREIRDWWLGVTPRPDLYALSFAAALALARAWHAEKAEQIRKGIALPGTSIVDLPGGWSLHTLATRAQLEAEGAVMGNCVGDVYVDPVTRGRARVLSLRDPGGVSVVDLALGKDGTLVDVNGPRNRGIPARAHAALRAATRQVPALLDGFLGADPEIQADLGRVFIGADPERVVELDDASRGDTKPLAWALLGQAEAVEALLARVPAGSRQESLVLSWAQATGRVAPVAWILLDRAPGDNLLAVHVARAARGAGGLDPRTEARLRAVALRSPVAAWYWATRVDRGPRDDTRAAVLANPAIAWDYTQVVEGRGHPDLAEAVRRDPSLGPLYEEQVPLNPPTEPAIRAILERAAWDQGSDPGAWVDAAAHAFVAAWEDLRAVAREHASIADVIQVSLIVPGTAEREGLVLRSSGGWVSVDGDPWVREPRSDPWTLVADVFLLEDLPTPDPRVTRGTAYGGRVVVHWVPR